MAKSITIPFPKLDKIVQLLAIGGMAIAKVADDNEVLGNKEISNEGWSIANEVANVIEEITEMLKEQHSETSNGHIVH